MAIRISVGGGELVDRHADRSNSVGDHVMQSTLARASYFQHVIDRKSLYLGRILRSLGTASRRAHAAACRHRNAEERHWVE